MRWSMVLGLLAIPGLSLAGTERYAVVVGANSGGAGRLPLVFAHDDADRVAATLQDVGMVEASHMTLLKDPTPGEVLEAIEGVGRRADGDDLVVFYYSGHADGNALYPGGRALAVGEVRQALEAVPVGLRIGVVDACRGGGWTRAKGLVAVEPFDIDEDVLEQTGTVLVSSSSGQGDAHEAASIGGSFFTHHWVAGLRGAADRDGDRRVSLEESLGYARDHTIRDTAQLVRSPQRPSFDMRVKGHGEVSLAELTDGSLDLAVSFDSGRLDVFDLDTGRSVASLDSRQAGRPLALPAGRYLLVRTSGRWRAEREVVVLDEGVLRLVDDDFDPVDTIDTGTKGKTTLATQASVPPGQFQLSGGVSWVSYADNRRDGFHLLVRPAELSIDVHGVVGLSRRWMLALPMPVLGVRLGGEQGTQAVVRAGLDRLTVGLPVWLERMEYGQTTYTRSWSIRSRVGAGVDLMVPLGRGWTLETRARADTSASAFPEDLAASLAVGVSKQWGEHVVLSVGVGVDDIGMGTRLVVGSLFSRAMSPLPLVRVRLGRLILLDVHGSIDVLDRRQSHAGLGLTWTTPRPRRVRERP